VKKCAECGRDANPAVYRYIDMQRPLCRSCADPQSPSVTAFVKGGGAASNYREPGPVVKRNPY
jgi:hypothetical protein